MAEICPFKNDSIQPCPMEHDVIEVSGPCKVDEYGKTCGPIAMYGMLLNQYEGLEALDKVLPIKGTFTVDTVPEGTPPLDVRENWVGVELPLRQPRMLRHGEVTISPADAILSLLAFGKLDAATWFIETSAELAPLGPYWVFRSNDGRIAAKESTTSVEYYGSRLDGRIRQAVQEA